MDDMPGEKRRRGLRNETRRRGLKADFSTWTVVNTCLCGNLRLPAFRGRGRPGRKAYYSACGRAARRARHGGLLNMHRDTNLSPPRYSINSIWQATTRIAAYAKGTAGAKTCGTTPRAMLIPASATFCWAVKNACARRRAPLLTSRSITYQDGRVPPWREG